MYVVPLMALGAHVDADLEPEPVAADADHQRAEVPEQGHETRGLAFHAEDQDRGRHHEGDEAVHHEQVRLAPVGILELARGQDFVGQGADGQTDLLGAADFTLGQFLERLAFLEEILGALLVLDVEQGAADDQKDHRHDIGLHHARRNERRQLDEGIAGNHLIVLSVGLRLRE
jgi:hypothetical protein